MINVNLAAKLMGVSTFCVLFFVLLRDGKTLSFFIFFFAFLCGFVIRKKRFFWRLSSFFFGILSVIYSFRLFGGLEPNSAGILAAKQLLSVESFLFVMLIFSLIASVIAGIRVREGLSKTKLGSG